MRFVSTVLKPARTIHSRTLIIAAAMLVMFAPNAFNFLPFMLAGAAESLTLTDAQVENITAMELLATAIASLLFSLLLIRRVNWRYIGYLSAIALIVGNVLSLQSVSYDQFLLARILSGSGQGIGYSLGLVGMSVTANPGKNFGYMIAALNVWLITWFVALPPLMESFGLAALFYFFIAASALCLVAFWFYPDNGRLERDAHQLKLSGTAADQRFSHTGIMVVIGLANAAVCYAMAVTSDTSSYLIFSCLYIILWNVAYARYYTALATTDRSGYFSSYGPEIGTVGIAAGPALAQALTVTGDFQGQVAIGAYSIVLATVLVVIGMSRAQKVSRAAEPVAAQGIG